MSALKRASNRKNSAAKPPQGNIGFSGFQGLIKEEKVAEPRTRERGSSISKKYAFQESPNTSRYTNEIFIESDRKFRDDPRRSNGPFVTGGFKFDLLATSIKRDVENMRERFVLWIYYINHFFFQKNIKTIIFFT